MPRTAKGVGVLSPPDATTEIYENGLSHLYAASYLSFVKNINGGILFSFAGLFSLIASASLPEIRESNPGFRRLVQGATFSLGIVIVYFVGAEL